MSNPFQSTPASVKPPSRPTGLVWDRVLAIMNWMVAGSLFILITPILGLAGYFLLLLLLSSSAGGAGMSGGGAGMSGGGPGMSGGGGMAGAMAIGIVLYGGVVSFVVVLPFGIWLWLIARWLWRGDARGRQHLWWQSGLTLFASVLTIGCAAVSTREPLGHYVLAMPVFAWALGQLLVLFRLRAREVR